MHADNQHENLLNNDANRGNEESSPDLQLPVSRPGLSRWRGGRYCVVNQESSGTIDIVWVIEKGDSMTRLRKMMLEELQRRNYSAIGFTMALLVSTCSILSMGFLIAS